MLINKNIDVRQKSILTFETAVKTEQRERERERGLFIAPVICLLLAQKATVPNVLKVLYILKYEHLYLNYLSQIRQKILEFLAFVMQNNLSELSIIVPLQMNQHSGRSQPRRIKAKEILLVGTKQQLSRPSTFAKVNGLINYLKQEERKKL